VSSSGDTLVFGASTDDQHSFVLYRRGILALRFNTSLAGPDCVPGGTSAVTDSFVWSGLSCGPVGAGVGSPLLRVATDAPYTVTLVPFSFPASDPAPLMALFPGDARTVMAVSGAFGNASVYEFAFHGASEDDSSASFENLCGNQTFGLPVDSNPNEVNIPIDIAFDRSSATFAVLFSGSELGVLQVTITHKGCSKSIISPITVSGPEGSTSGIVGIVGL
jgi:hypothetical protein